MGKKTVSGTPSNATTLILCIFLAFITLSVPVTGLAEGIRSYDGTGNNSNPTKHYWGAAETPYIREMPVVYADGVSEPVADLPNPRQISNTIFSSAPFSYNVLKVSSMAGAFGQLVAHDIGMTADSDEAMNFASPTGDPTFDPAGSGTQEILFFRSVSEMVNGAREQINYQTSYLDLSTVYSTSFERLSKLRTFTRGLLAQDPDVGVIKNAVGVDMAGPNPNLQRAAGDKRANVNPGLLSMHGLFTLEHNRLAREIYAQNPKWSDEQIFQEARKWNIAIFQAITVNEYLPVVAGAGIPAYQGYSQFINASTDNFFSTAAYRYGHSVINMVYQRFGKSLAPDPFGHVLLRDSYFKPDYMEYGGLLPVILGLIFQPEQDSDLRMVEDLRNFVEGMKSDLAARDIQRGRDHGLPRYNQAREFLGLKPAEDFSDINPDFKVYSLLAEAYDNDVSKVDAWVGGLAEVHVANGTVGELFQKSFLEQFMRYRDGDYFWYQNYFTEEEITDIMTNHKLAHVIKRNLDLEYLPNNVFTSPKPADYLKEVFKLERRRLSER